MEKEKKYLKKRIQIAEWPEIERKMGIIARMTSEPLPPKDNDILETKEILGPETFNTNSTSTE